MAPVKTNRKPKKPKTAPRGPGRPFLHDAAHVRLGLWVDPELKAAIAKAWPALERSRRASAAIAHALEHKLPEDELASRIRKLSTPQRQVIERVLDQIGTATPR